MDVGVHNVCVHDVCSGGWGVIDVGVACCSGAGAGGGCGGVGCGGCERDGGELGEEVGCGVREIRVVRHDCRCLVVVRRVV